MVTTLESDEPEVPVQKVADSVSSSSCINTECSTLFVLRASISQHRHIRGRSLGGSIVQLMHKEAGRAEETVCGH